MNKQISAFSAAALAAIALTVFCGCGPAGGGGGTGAWAGGGTGGTGVHVGSVSGFGSVFVNEIEFNTTDALVVIGGEEVGTGDSAVLDHLATGKVVRVEGVSNSDGTGVATRVVYSGDVIGPVHSVSVIDGSTRRLVVMGQAIIVTGLTAFAGATLESIAEGNVIEVSGFTDDTGAIRASFVEKRSEAYTPTEEAQIRGVASGVDTLARSLAIGSLAVDYSAADTSRLPAGAPAEGQMIRVKGTLEPDGTLAATTLAPDDILGVDDADEAGIAGIVTAFTSIAEFELGGIAVRTDAGTDFSDLLPEDIGAGSLLIIDGVLENRVLRADRVRSPETVKLESDVVANGGSRFTLLGLESVALTTNELTKFLGAAEGLDQIEPGYHVKVFGDSFSAGSVTASKLIVMSKSKKIVNLRGPVEGVGGTVLTVLGEPIDTAGLPDEGFRLADGTVLTRTEFLDLVSLGDSVNLRGRPAGAGVRWDSLEIDQR